MTRHNELKGDPTEYNPDKGESGSENVENVPMPGDDETPTGAHTLDAAELRWDGDAIWFDCPYCGDRLCASWFYAADSACGECGAEISVTITVEK